MLPDTANCNMCFSLTPLLDLVQDGDWPDSIGYLCPTCAEKVHRKYHRDCEICGAEFRIKIRGSKETRCYRCASAKVYKSTVRQQNNRAWANGCVGNLTPDQWDFAVKYFEGKCAYCLNKSWAVIEHYIPIALGGDTTASNCLPSCYACNTQKNRIHPHEKHYQWGLTPESISRIEAYFELVRGSNE